MLTSTAVQAKIYHYTDKKGHSVYVDNLASVPAQHRQRFIDEQTEIEESTYSTTDKTQQNSTDWDSRWQELIINSEPEPAAQQAQTTSVQIINNQVIVPVQIKLKRKKVQLNLLLDTGASITVLHGHSINKLKLSKTKSRRAKIADGSTVDIKVVKMTELSVGPIRIQNTPVAIIDNKGRRQQFDGLLGLDTLRHHPFNIDHQNQRIIWQ
jgi:predicted aspartyl protease